MSELYPPESQRMDLVGHLDELRRRILACLAFFLVAAIILFSQGYLLLDLLEVPARGSIPEFIFTGPAEAFSTYFKVVLLGSFIVCFPFVLYQLWAFLAPAMTSTVRRAGILWFLFALVSFAGGIAFAYAVLLPSAVKFLVGFGAGIARPMISLSQYISFAVAIILITGAIFEIPLLMGILSELGILRTSVLRSSRRYAILAIFIVAAVITPTPDAFNMMIFAVPMVLLYELGMGICGFIEKRKRAT